VCLETDPRDCRTFLISEQVARGTGWLKACTGSSHGYCTARIQEAEASPAGYRWIDCVRGTSGGNFWCFAPEARGAICREKYSLDGHGEARFDAAAGTRARLAGSEPGIH